MTEATEIPSLPSLDEEVWTLGSRHAELPLPERVRVSYLRARSIVKKLGMTVDDIVNLTPKFVGFHMGHNDHIIVGADTATITILTMHWNLCIGTISMYPSTPDTRRVMERLLNFDTVGIFMLTELGHGLDARNIETTATLQADGSFILHTPNEAAAKTMPPASLWAGMPRVAVVYARLVVNGEKRGPQPFLVHIHDADNMAPGISCRMLPSRPGATPLDHTITYFNHVRLPPSALLAGQDVMYSPDTRESFFRHISRVTVGTLVLSMTTVGALKLAGYLAAKYSQKRKIASYKPGEAPVPIITFGTQHGPILAALTHGAVLEAYANWTVPRFLDSAEDPRLQSALAVAFKATAVHYCQSTLSELIDRCGWQGLFAHNQISETALAQRGNSIAEGDVLVLCIRLVSELILGRYTLPEAEDPDCLLARHELGVWEEAQQAVESLLQTDSSHRDQGFNSLILPRCRSLVLASGQRMAYEAAKHSADVKPEMLRLFEMICIMDDMSWYVEHAGLKRKDMFEEHAKAVASVLPLLEALLEASSMEPWATAPFLDAEKWGNFVSRLELFGNPQERGDEGFARMVRSML